MQKVVIRIAGSILGLASLFHLYGATLGGVTLPDSLTAGNTTLVLNGLGLRTKYMVKVYVAGLYLRQKSSDADAIVKAEEPKRIVMHFVHNVSKNQMTDAFKESFHNNSPETSQSMKVDIDRLLGALEPLSEQDEMVFTYIPGTGTTLAIRGQDKLTIPGPAFGQLVFSVWLGPKPPNAGLKKGLLAL